jgi:hypothetical protein
MGWVALAAAPLLVGLGLSIWALPAGRWPWFVRWMGANYAAAVLWALWVLSGTAVYLYAGVAVLLVSYVSAVRLLRRKPDQDLVAWNVVSVIFWVPAFLVMFVVFIGRVQASTAALGHMNPWSPRAWLAMAVVSGFFFLMGIRVLSQTRGIAARQRPRE